MGLFHWRRLTQTWERRRAGGQMFKPVILVTGCGSGIGRALAELLLERTEYRVVVTARGKSYESLKQSLVESDRFLIRALDVTSEIDRVALISEIQGMWGAIHILVNNAGISYRSVVEQMTEADEQIQMATNYLGPAGLIRLVVPSMRERGRGKIINVSSVSGMLAMPTMASYSASKYALEGMSEALWYEMKPLGINVSLIQPGFIHSNSFKNVYYSKLSRPEVSGQGPYADYYSNMNPFIEKLMGMSPTTSRDVARTILKVIRKENPPLWIPATWDAIFFYYVRRMLPRRFLLPILFNLLPRARHWARDYTQRRQ